MLAQDLINQNKKQFDKFQTPNELKKLLSEELKAVFQPKQESGHQYTEVQE